MSLISTFIGYTTRQLCVESDCDFYWHLDSSVKLENAMTLRLLVEQNRPVVAPYLSDHDGYNINFDVVLFTHGNRFIPLFFKSFEYHPELDIPHHRSVRFALLNCIAYYLHVSSKTTSFFPLELVFNRHHLNNLISITKLRKQFFYTGFPWDNQFNHSMLIA